LLTLRRHWRIHDPHLQGERWVGMVLILARSLPVIPAEAGIQLLALDSLLKCKAFVSPCGRAGYFLALPKK
ncbi:MAG TPA: hypothetical protein VFE67_04095, partial [Rudaea sp.]|nr:hypothetical protein [Rudaea sp.]